MSKTDISEIIRVYDAKLIRLYCWIRFKILHLRFLDEIGQYFPTSGRIIDIGCGFGLFSLYYAKKYPGLQIIGIDINARRIQIARKAARSLSLDNVSYEVANATIFDYGKSFDGAYMLDIIHHIPRHAVKPLLLTLYEVLCPERRLIIKDVDTKPVWKRWFTHILDKMLDMKTQVNYWEETALTDLIKDTGFDVFHHSMIDILPYPHILYICQRPHKNELAKKD